MLPFAGWEMPIQYAGIVSEHRAVREAVGVFDISHMGELEVTGRGAEEALNRLLTNDVTKLGDGEGQYTLMLNESGGVIDDLILYRISQERFLLVVNASKAEEDVSWITARLGDEATLLDRSQELGGIAVQGPEVSSLWDSLESSLALPERNGIVEDGSSGVVLCRTGYTGEDGFELFAPIDAIGSWFREILEKGATPCGLGARDTLRLEKCYPLNGNDLDSDHTPLEAGLGFFVNLEKTFEFPGRTALLEQKEKGLTTRLSAIRMTGKGPPPRHGYEVRDEEGEVALGELSSGSLSPTLGVGIGMAYLPVASARPGTPVTVEIRGRIFPAEVVKKPFL